MRSWLFIFGRSQELSLSELVSIVPLPIKRVAPEVVRVEDSQETLVPEALIARLGGTVKIARERGTVACLTPESLSTFFNDKPKTLTFGVSAYGDTRAIDSWLLGGIKNALETRGIHARYVVSKDEKTLSSVVVKKQNVHELVVIAEGDRYIVGETAVVQAFEVWNERDYGRPFADPRSGMLPPKVARMAVNLAHSEVLRPTSGVLLDPFCGMGTILGEALLTDWRVYGSDQSEEVVEKAKKNLSWLLRSHPASQGETFKELQFFVSDATHVSEHLPAQSVDAIVTEPYLGPVRVEERKAKDIIKGLEKLYIGCLRDWYHVLKSDGKIVIALPEYAVNGKTFFVKSVIDRCEILGYTVTQGPLPYSRSQAIVKRKFYVLEKNKPINK